jgi:hypothetical protein
MRQEGMVCFVQATLLTYQLQGGITNAHWVAFGGGGGVGPISTRTNVSGGLLAEGAIVSQHVSTANALMPCDIADHDLGVAKPVGIVTESGGIAAAATGDVLTIQGAEASVLLRPGLTLAGDLGEEVIMSTVLGEGTLPGSGVSEPSATPQSAQRVGILIDPLTYDGVTDLLAKVQIDFSKARKL